MSGGHASPRTMFVAMLARSQIEHPEHIGVDNAVDSSAKDFCGQLAEDIEVKELDFRRNAAQTHRV